jgi:radical SAM protein with 4Fe4S-binding SPASM domain
VRHAEGNGQITGLNTNARRLSDPILLQKLIDAGLDHVQITVESHDPIIHDRMVHSKGAWEQTIAGLKNVLASRLYVMTNTTLLRQNCRELLPTLRFLHELGVPTVGLNALIYSGRGSSVGDGLDEKELEPLLLSARDFTEQSGQRLIWYSPTEYCHFDPVLLDLGVKGCTAALYNMCIEPDGSVIPCQSYYQPVGKILETPWEEIWNHDLSVSLRERKNVPEKCTQCSLLAECGGGCPLHRQA